MKKVILFIDNLGSGGAQRQVANIALLLKKAGYDIEVLVYQDIPFYKSILDENGITVTFVESKNNLSRVLNVRKYLNQSGADVVIAFLETPGFIACVSKIGYKKWKLITNELSAKMSTFTSKRNRFFNLFEKFSDAKVGNSWNAIRMWEKYYPQYNDKYSVIYNPVLIPDEVDYLTHKYAKDGKVVLTVVASYQQLKNPIRLIEAFNMLDENQKEKLVVNWYGREEITVGNTETYDKTKELIEKYGLSDYIHLHNETSEIYKIMSQSDAVGLFSTVEGLPNTICEAMCLGKPIIMSRVSDYDVLVKDNGYLCDPESVESIKDVLVKLIETPLEKLETMGRASKNMAKDLFSAKAITEQWTQIIEGL